MIYFSDELCDLKSGSLVCDYLKWQTSHRWSEQFRFRIASNHCLHLNDLKQPRAVALNIDTGSTLRTEQNGQVRAFTRKNFYIFINISLIFFLRGSINNDAPLVGVTACCRIGDKPLPEPMMP